ncbi:phosphate/phosphite/phosphonate ABC transporter substrate-binding protein [Solibacillus silvestris]|uniref:phosphate/phosphite/phosphonate ABC transporter substrate-binding protein n=1 Tax=Solibacillus silvestris TaxID=76853 RepID=UPI003F7EB960
MKKFSKVLALAGMVTMLAACGKSDNTKDAAASEQQWPEKLTLVQMPNENDPTVTQSMHTQLREHLSEELGIEVVEHQGGSYAVGIEALASGNLDVLLATPMSYYQANKVADAELLVTPAFPEGVFKYYTSFITHADNDEINSLADLKGTNFAFVNAASSSGYLYPKGTLVQELDLDSNRIEQSGYFFENVTFSESHPNSVIGVAMGDFEAAAAARAVIDSLIEVGQIQEDDIKEIGRSIDIPDPSYIVRGNLPDDFVDALREAFLSFDNEEYFEAIHGDKTVRFQATPENFYEDSIEMLSKINALEEDAE